jgi:hypothetical protein
VNLFFDGTDSIRYNDVTAAKNVTVVGHVVVDNGFTLRATDTLSVDGGSAILENLNGLARADSLFTTLNGGTYVSQSSTAAATFHDVVWNGGDERGLLTAGGMDVTGDFSVLTAGPTFRADSLFAVNFVGAVAHDLIIDVIAPVQYFGGLGISGAGASLNLSFAGELQVYKFSATGGATINGSLNPIQAERLAINGVNLNQTAIHVLTNSDQSEQFDGVTFTGFGANDIQLFFEHPAHAGSFTFNGVNFDNAATPPTGYFLLTNRTGVSGTLSINMGGPDFAIGAVRSLLGGSTSVNWAAGF